MAEAVVRNSIGGRWEDASTGKTGEVRSPADLREVLGRFQLSSKEDARRAIDAASAAFRAWADTPAFRRAEILGRALAAIVRRQEEIAEVLCRENGKTLREARGEVASAIKEMDWQIAEGRRLCGQTVPSERDGVFACTIRQPLGVASVISPWNFPFNVPCRKCVPALMAGNTVVFKPASLTPHSGAIFVEAFEEAGLPAGVLNLVTGSGGTVGEEMVTNPAIRAISFTGSTPVGTGIHAKAAATLARTQLEMGGKNPAVVLADADLDAAAEGTVTAAYACAGQWCTSTSRAIVEAPVLDRFLGKVLDRVRAIRVGDGRDPATTMGPVCGEDQLRTVLSYIEKGVKEGAKVLDGGRRILEGALAHGCFIEPTVFAGVRRDMAIAREEIFGPVLAVIRVEDFEEAVAVANEIEFGLASSIYTSSLERALSFAERTDVGLTHVNLPTAHKEPGLPFGGIKASGAGLPEAGQTGIEFFSRHKAVYIKYR
jgi:acyl-CoA reductase-like NAD-dependent aldehyde dehydrogenase